MSPFMTASQIGHIETQTWMCLERAGWRWCIQQKIISQNSESENIIASNATRISPWRGVQSWLLLAQSIIRYEVAPSRAATCRWLQHPFSGWPQRFSEQIIQGHSLRKSRERTQPVQLTTTIFPVLLIPTTPSRHSYVWSGSIKRSRGDDRQNWLFPVIKPTLCRHQKAPMYNCVAQSTPNDIAWFGLIEREAQRWDGFALTK